MSASLPNGEAPRGEPIRIYFSPLTPGCEGVPIAKACVPEWRVREPVVARNFQVLFDAAPPLWRSTPFEEAQVAVCTDDNRDTPAAAELAERARRAGLPCLFFDTSDFHTPRHPAHGLAYRAAIIASQMTPAERAMPPVCGDLLSGRAGKAPPRELGPKPVVGFCGYLLPRWMTLAWHLRGQKDKAEGHRVRRLATDALRRSPLVTTNFIIRRSYMGGLVRAGGGTPEQAARVREEFVENTVGSDYVLCARGAGNFSFRFYETLSAGRIPLLIDTDCVLPFSDRIDWRRHCVFVPGDRIADAPKILADFHRSLSPAQFLELQAQNRELWDRYLNPVSFHRIVIEESVRSSAGAKA
jgi:hypothetical protein